MRKKLLTNGNVFKGTDGRWGGVVWYMDEQGNRTEQEAEKMCSTYFDGKPGKKLHISDISDKTPCGEYWFNGY